MTVVFSNAVFAARAAFSGLTSLGAAAFKRAWPRGLELHLDSAVARFVVTASFTSLLETSPRRDQHVCEMRNGPELALERDRLKLRVALRQWTFRAKLPGQQFHDPSASRRFT
ncbi:MAG: hypothetical protein DME00_33505 [Candidatus Rokuibacteriota bacterium]|nr:MAG: hypothetical protein DME00_33505 [Candidatus Rokubacteria bacterium]